MTLWYIRTVPASLYRPPETIPRKIKGITIWVSEYLELDMASTRKGEVAYNIKKIINKKI